MPPHWKLFIYIALASALNACGGGSSSPSAPTDTPNTPAFQTKLTLGESLFFDENLSFNHTQPYSTCHNPDRAFVDDKKDEDNKTLATSLGDNGFSLGDRNASSLLLMPLRKALPNLKNRQTSHPSIQNTINHSQESTDLTHFPKPLVAKLFSSPQIIQTAQHVIMLNANNDRSETFTSYEHHNIGAPVNTDVRAANNVETNFIGKGLGANANITADVSSDIGKHKVPTLRNIALTAPYMHNGVFKELETVLKFYDHYLAGSTNTMNPETG